MVNKRSTGVFSASLRRRSSNTGVTSRLRKEPTPGIIPTLVALRQRFEGIRRAELTRLEPKLSVLSPEGRTRLDEITRHIVEKLLLTPAEQLKLVSDGTMRVRYIDALSRLFRLAVDDQVESL